MPKRYNTPHRSRVVKTRLSEDEFHQQPDHGPGADDAR